MSIRLAGGEFSSEKDGLEPNSPGENAVVSRGQSMNQSMNQREDAFECLWIARSTETLGFGRQKLSDSDADFVTLMTVSAASCCYHLRLTGHGVLNNLPKSRVSSHHTSSLIPSRSKIGFTFSGVDPRLSGRNWRAVQSSSDK